MPPRHNHAPVLHPPVLAARSMRSLGTAPSLAYSASSGPSSAASVSSAVTRRTVVTDEQFYRLPKSDDSEEESEEDEDEGSGSSSDNDSSAEDIALIPPLPCPYRFLNICCAGQLFSTFKQWNTHCQWHFSSAPPYSACCPFAECTWRPVYTQDVRLSREEQMRQAWEEQKRHIRREHLRARGRLQGQIDSSRRPDRNLLLYFWEIRVIDGGELKLLESTGRLPGQAGRRDSSAYTVSGGLQEERQRRRSRFNGRGGR